MSGHLKGAQGLCPASIFSRSICTFDLLDLSKGRYVRQPETRGQLQRSNAPKKSIPHLVSEVGVRIIDWLPENLKKTKYYKALLKRLLLSKPFYSVLVLCVHGNALGTILEIQELVPDKYKTFPFLLFLKVTDVLHFNYLVQIQ